MCLEDKNRPDFHFSLVSFLPKLIIFVKNNKKNSFERSVFKDERDIPGTYKNHIIFCKAVNTPCKRSLAISGSNWEVFLVVVDAVKTKQKWKFVFTKKRDLHGVEKGAPQTISVSNNLWEKRLTPCIKESSTS